MIAVNHKTRSERVLIDSGSSALNHRRGEDNRRGRARDFTSESHFA